MRNLLDRFDETVSLAVYEHGEIVIIDGMESRQSIRRGANIGERDNWYISSLGKAIMAHLNANELRRILDTHPFTRPTAKSIRDVDSLLADLERIREQGYALDDEESQIGLKCVGVALCDPAGRHSHALSISGPTRRIDDQLDEIVRELLVAARSVGRGSVGAMS
jgi:IclR family acetate operon transcriptional repressor